MKTILLDSPGRLLLSDSKPPGKMPPGEALVRVRRVGVCGTDMHAFRGRQPFFTYPRILGHELGVEVLEVGENPHGIRSGDRCAVEPYLNCGRCIACRAGKTNCCESLQVLGVHVDGGMREMITVPVDKLHRSESLSLDQLALVETLGIGAHAVERAALKEGESVLVIGAGPIGLAVTQFALIAGARVTLSDVNEERLRFAENAYGIRTIALRDADTLEEIRGVNGGELPTAVFDATGNAESMQSSFRYAAHGGRIVFVGLVLSDITFYDPDFHRKELTLLATRNSTAETFRQIIALMEAGRIDSAPWITHREPVEAAAERFPTWLEPDSGVIKAMIEF